MVGTAAQRPGQDNSLISEFAVKQLVALLFLVLLGACQAGETKPYLQRFDRPLHISHRGGAEVFPDNTLLAYENAIALYQTDVLEIDVHRTKDGSLVVLHDAFVDLTTDGHGLVKEMNLEAVQALDAGYRFTTDRGVTRPYRGMGLQIPTLAEVFQAFPDHLTNIEVKQLEPRIETDLVQMIRDFHMVDKVCLGSFDDRSAEILRELLPEACHYAPESMATQFYASTRVALGGAYPLPVDAFSLPPTSGVLDVLDEGTINAIHDRGLFVWAWTINEEDEMKRLLKLGVDGIMTDRPDLLHKVMQAEGIR